jgi:sucrase/ferredoxin-like protein
VNRTGCAAIRAALGEPLHGSAPAHAGGWLLIEHPGPWPSDGPPADLPPAAARAWYDAVDCAVRPQLIRRVSGRRRVPPHRVYVAWTRGSPGWVEAAELPDLRALAELDLAGLAVGKRPGFGAEVHGPFLLVCTHGRRDACCARWGRAVARALHARYADAVWETTHVGGDRYAANVVCLPYGTYHGGADTSSAVAVGAAALSGRVSLPHYRGRCGVPEAVQSADWFVRRETGVTGVHDVLVVGWVTGPDAVTTVEFDVTGRGRLRVSVRRVRAEAARLTSCADGGVCAAPEYHALVAVEAPLPS